MMPDPFNPTLVRAPTSEEIALFLSSRSGTQMVELVQSISEPSAQGALATALSSPPATPANETVSDGPLGVEKADKAKKALNAFVGYRCYYLLVPTFKPWPMKKLSHVLATMWDTDPNKSIWALLTKAWSLIRDQIGKDRAPLDKYFKIMCPVMSIPCPEIYLEQCGWVLKVSDNGDPFVSRDFTPARSPETMSNPTMSIGDIIRYCHSMGYAQEFELDESVTPTTFHIQLGPRLRTSNDVVENMEKKRIAKRNKRRAQRQKSRENGLPDGVKQKRAVLRDFHRSSPSEHLLAPPISSILPEETDQFLPMSYTQTVAQQDFVQLDPMLDLVQTAQPQDAMQTASLENPDFAWNDDGFSDFPFQEFTSQSLTEVTAEADNPAMSFEDASELSFRAGAGEDATLPEFFSGHF